MTTPQTATDRPALPRAISGLLMMLSLASQMPQPQLIPVESHISLHLSGQR